MIQLLDCASDLASRENGKNNGWTLVELVDRLAVNEPWTGGTNN